VADLPGALAEALSGGGRILGLAADILTDRLELLGLETREVKIRLVQFLILACLGAALLVLGLALAILAVLFATPPELRLAVTAALAGLCLAAGAAAFFSLRRRVARLPLAFSQTIGELKKDRECF